MRAKSRFEISSKILLTSLAATLLFALPASAGVQCAKAHELGTLTAASQLQSAKLLKAELEAVFLHKAPVMSSAFLRAEVSSMERALQDLHKTDLAQNDFVQSKIDELLRALQSPTMTSQDYFHLSFEFVSLHEMAETVMKSPFLLEYFPPKNIFEQKLRDLKFNYSNIKQQPGDLLVPMMRDLNHGQLNELWVMGIYPLGITAKPVFADGRWMGPEAFLLHDLNHLDSIPPNFRVKLSETAQLYFKWKAEIANQSPEFQEAFEKLIFISIHERGSQPLENKQKILTEFFKKGFFRVFGSPSREDIASLAKALAYLSSSNGNLNSPFDSAIVATLSSNTKIDMQTWVEVLTYFADGSML